jgi:transposase InsO family protein
VSHPDQVWVCDITYLNLQRSRFAYLFVIMDLYSRCIVGWHVSSSLAAEGAARGLQMALADTRTTPSGLIHHSDRAPVRAFNPVGQMSPSLRRRELLNILPEGRKAAGDQAGW